MTTTNTVGTPLQAGFCFWYMRRGKGSNNNNNQKDKDASEGKSDAESKQETPSSPPPSSSPDANQTNSNTKNNSSNGNQPTNATTNNPANPYENSIKRIATVKTVEEFWSTYDYLTRPNDLPTTTDYHFFREGIKPTWEDPHNARGGKWIVRLRKGLASRYWEEVVLALIGSQFMGIPDGEVCGVVVSIRYSEDIVSVWNKTANDRDITDRLRDGLKRILQLPSFVHMEYKPHETSLQDKSSFRNTQVWKPKSALEREAASSSTGGLGGVGTGGGSGTISGSSGGLGSSGSSGRIHRSGSWGDRDELRGGKSKRDIDRAWR